MNRDPNDDNGTDAQFSTGNADLAATNGSITGRPDTEIEAAFRRAFERDRTMNVELTQGDEPKRKILSLPRRPLNAEPRSSEREYE